MMPERPGWLARWQQADDDELLYVDQTLLVRDDMPAEDYCGLSQMPAAEEPDDADMDWMSR